MAEERDRLPTLEELKQDVINSGRVNQKVYDENTKRILGMPAVLWEVFNDIKNEPNPDDYNVEILREILNQPGVTDRAKKEINTEINRIGHEVGMPEFLTTKEIILPPLALNSMTFPINRSYVSSGGAMNMMGKFFLTKEIGPCFACAAEYPSIKRQAISLSLRPPSFAVAIEIPLAKKKNCSAISKFFTIFFRRWIWVFKNRSII